MFHPPHCLAHRFARLPRAARAWALALIGWILASLAQAAWATETGALVLRDAARSLDLWPHVTVLADPQGELDVAQVLAEPQRFAAPDGHEGNLGIRQGATWLKVTVEVPRGESGRWLFDIDYPSLDQADLFVVREGQVVHQVRLGDLQVFSNRPLPTRSHAAPLELAPGGTMELLLRVQTTSTTIVPIRLYRADAYYEREASAQALQALLAGVWLCLCLYSLTQWAILRDAMFGFYALTILSTGLFFAGYFGLGPQHLWGDNLWLTQHMALISVMFGLIGGLLFIDRTLDVPSISRHAARLVRVLVGCIGLVVAGVVVGAIPYRSAQTFATALGLSPMLLAVPMSWLRWRRGDRAAAYMLLGWLIYAVGAAHQALLLRGLLDATFWNQHAFQFGSVGEMVLWMMVLGARMDEIRTRAAAAHRERDRLHSLAHTDALTGLLNRRGLQGAIEGLLRGATPHRTTAVFLLDLDGFKPVNDTLGHDAGDELLRQVGDRLQAQLRTSDLVARLGGDEFVVAVGGLPGDSEADAVGRKLLQAFQAPFEVPQGRCRIGLTIGIACAPVDGLDLPTLLKRADRAMYAGKQAGKNRVQRCAAASELVSG